MVIEVWSDEVLPGDILVAFWREYNSKWDPTIKPYKVTRQVKGKWNCSHGTWEGPISTARNRMKVDRPSVQLSGGLIEVLVWSDELVIGDVVTGWVGNPFGGDKYTITGFIVAADGLLPQCKLVGRYEGPLSYTRRHCTVLRSVSAGWANPALAEKLIAMLGLS